MVLPDACFRARRGFLRIPSLWEVGLAQPARDRHLVPRLFGLPETRAATQTVDQQNQWPWAKTMLSKAALLQHFRQRMRVDRLWQLKPSQEHIQSIVHLRQLFNANQTLQRFVALFNRDGHASCQQSAPFRQRDFDPSLIVVHAFSFDVPGKLHTSQNPHDAWAGDKAVLAKLSGLLRSVFQKRTQDAPLLLGDALLVQQWPEVIHQHFASTKHQVGQVAVWSFA